MTDKTVGGGSLRVWVNEKKIVAQRYIAGGNLEDLLAAEKAAQEALTTSADVLFRMGAVGARSPYNPSRAKYSVEASMMVVTCSMSCDIVGVPSTITVKLKQAFPANFTVYVR